MKRCFVCFSVFAAMILAVSCNDGVKFENPNDMNADVSDSSDSQNDEDNDSADTENSGKKQGELYGECYPNKTCNEGLVCEIEDNVCVRDSNNPGNNDDSDSTSEQGNGDNDADTTPDSSDSAPDNDADTDSGDSAPDNDADTDTTPADPCTPNPCKSVANSTKECSVFGGTTYKCECNSGYYWDGSTCGTTQTQTAACTGLISYAEWNTVSEIIQTWDENYGQWVPSNEGVYNETASTDKCRYKCKNNYFWNGSKCVDPCASNPRLSDGNSLCLRESLTDCTCKCKTGSAWNESESLCLLVDTAHLPECSPTNATPCKDSSTGYIWSERKDMSWQNAVDYCTGLNSQNYCDLSGWHLPTIDELKTIVSSGYSKLGDGDPAWFWSSELDDKGLACGVNVSSGSVAHFYKTDYNNVRCVRIPYF